MDPSNPTFTSSNNCQPLILFILLISKNNIPVNSPYSAVLCCPLLYESHHKKGK